MLRADCGDEILAIMILSSRNGKKISLGETFGAPFEEAVASQHNTHFSSAVVTSVERIILLVFI
jgi:hypothetical protein